MTSKKLASTIAQLTLTKKAEDIIILDLRKLTSITDYFVICSGQTDMQARAIADAVVEGLLPKRVKPWHREGYEVGSWVLLDFVDVVAHIFQQETRDYYRLEELWGDAPAVIVSDTFETPPKGK
jgi:ribosome-associated protein